MTADEALTIPESLMLLALHGESGERRGSFLEYVLAGAALAELLLRERIAETGEPPKRLALVDAMPTGDAFLDRCLEAFAKKGSGKKAETYVSSIGSKRGLLPPLFAALERRGVIAMQRKKAFFFFTKTVWPEADPAAERALKERLERMMFGAGEVEARDAVIIALAKHADLLKRNFDGEQLKAYKDRIKEIAEGALLPAAATGRTIEAVQAAILVAVVIPAIAGASS